MTETNKSPDRFMYVTLTGTDNPYLADRLPLCGFIEFFEMSTYATIVSAVFRIENDTRDGLAGGPVEVKNPRFMYTGDVPSHETREALRRHLFGADTPAVGVCSRCGGPVVVPANDPNNREMRCCPDCTAAVLEELGPDAKTTPDEVRQALGHSVVEGDAPADCNCGGVDSTTRTTRATVPTTRPKLGFESEG